jgi:guanine deaminase
MRKIRTNVINPIDQDRAEFLPDHVLIWSSDRITALRPFDPRLDADAEDKHESLCLPGFIDLHVHLSQYRVRGLWEPDLLRWLDKFIFPEEARSHRPEYAKEVTRDFFHALFKAGTTTSVIYTAAYQHACETAFEAARQLGARALIGMTMMDANCPADLRQSADSALGESIRLFETHCNSKHMLKYIFTPRFALSCSPELMRKTGDFIRANNAWLQTHLSENPEEINEVQKLFPGKTYTEVYAELGLLSERTILAHAVHLSEYEIGLIATSGSSVAHCPDSNFFLKSGEFPYRDIADKGVKIGIGSDLAAGSTLNMLHHAKMANYRQSTYPLSPERLLWHITLGNARILQLDERIGSLDTGKDADLVFLNTPKDTLWNRDILSRLIFCPEEFPVVETVIAGKTVFSVGS